MAFVHGKDTKIFLNETDFSTYFNSSDSTRSVDIAESTTFGNSAKTYIVGNKDGTVSLTGFFDATADATLQPLLGGADCLLVIGVEGTDATDNVRFQNGNINNYGVSSPVGDIVATSIDFQSDKGLYDGKVLESATYTATASGTARDNTNSTDDGGAGFLIISAASGSSPTADIKITHSADDSTYADLVTFTQATGTTSEIKYVAEGTTVNRYLKVEATIGGTTPSFSAIVGFGRNKQ
ncbi:MAG: hypothetical protein Unbinned1469contig1000_10 [Prokaryotic dsDNA virus sp.]|jgi:hypothetical protein|nr:MAG: hypothetical protein Unbinned1469contig1000_10 [Prokaryotic dsDNA virus sp.]|tara:strand:+ start:283 stop:996 length:714 start_codon:yes stop_codon:yes gene_type:complete